MVKGNSADESFRQVVLASVKSSGFWSSVMALVGAVAMATGGVTLLTIEELKSFSVGVLAVGALLLFLSIILSPRAIAIFFIGRQGRYGTNAAIMTAAFFLMIVLINVLMFRISSRIDTTATRIFTLSPQSMRILEELDTPVRANAFFVKDSRSADLSQTAEDLLNEFRRRSSQFDYRFIDPELNRSLALEYAVTEYPSIVFESVQTGTQQGVTTFAEQNFITGILIATGTEQKRIYFLTGHNEAGITRDRMTGKTDLDGLDFAIEGMQRDNYATIPLNLRQFKDRGVPENAAVLVIAGPQKGLIEDESSALYEYISRGGNAVVLLDPEPPQSFSKLLSGWGIEISRDSVADMVSNVAGEMLTPMVQKTNGQFVSSGITGIGIVDQIDVAFFPGVAAISSTLPLEDMPPHINFAPLTQSSPLSWLEADPDNIQFSPDSELSGPFSLAVAIQVSGTLEDNPMEVGNNPASKLVVFGDSDFARNGYFYSNDNADIFLNSVNWLAEDYDLISIRPKLVPYRQLVVNSREIDFIKWSSWFLPPMIMVFLGLFVWWRRR